MASELAALERVERASDKPNETQKAFQTEYLTLVSQSTVTAADATTKAKTGDQTAKPSDKVDGKDTQAAQGPKSPIERLGDLLDQYENTGTLTPLMKKQMEAIIAETDKGPSPKIKDLEKQISDITEEAKKQFPKEKQEEAAALQKTAEDQIAKMSEKEQQTFMAMMLLRSLAPESDRKTIDAEIEKLAPGLMESSQKLKALLAPLREKYAQVLEVQAELDVEKKADLVSRLAYAEVLLDSDNEKEAQRYIREAATKDQELLKNPYFMDLASRAGLERKNLILYKV